MEHAHHPKAAEFNPTSYLKTKLSAWNAARPPFVTALIHENNFVYSGAGSWTLIYYPDTQKTKTLSPPFNLNAPDSSKLRSQSEQDLIWKAYDELVSYASKEFVRGHVRRYCGVGEDNLVGATLAVDQSGRPQGSPLPEIFHGDRKHETHYFCFANFIFLRLQRYGDSRRANCRAADHRLPRHWRLNQRSPASPDFRPSLPQGSSQPPVTRPPLGGTATDSVTYSVTNPNEQREIICASLFARALGVVSGVGLSAGWQGDSTNFQNDPNDLVSAGFVVVLLIRMDADRAREQKTTMDRSIKTGWRQ